MIYPICPLRFAGGSAGWAEYLVEKDRPLRVNYRFWLQECLANPQWFRERVGAAVDAAFGHDLIADLILAGPDTEDARATLRGAANNGDVRPYLRYVTARYGSYPNVWICLCNEFDIKRPSWEPNLISQMGQMIRQHLPYPTPLSVHASQHPEKGPPESRRASLVQGL